MLFNSLEYIFVFLPVVWLGFLGFGRLRNKLPALGWLVLASILFYAWWDPRYLLLLGGSMVANFLLGSVLSRHGTQGRLLLGLGIAANLGVLAWYKYAHFVAANLNTLGTTFDLPTIVLPLAISFFTFQQIAYLVDAYRGITKEVDFLRYVLFVTFFPQLIAGPIVHHGDVIPQFRRPDTYRFDLGNLTTGSTRFALGLFKKVVIADGIAVWADVGFGAAATGTSLGTGEAWIAAVAYSLQIYFDFSGYGDMAIGAAKLFGIDIAENFESPYKATSIADFWRRWHMTLSRFLRDYLYIPLGGNRRGPARRYLNLFLTMLLGGIWHGAGWTFVVWGALHGAYLIVDNAAQSIWAQLGRAHSRLGTTIARLVTLLAVIVGWVFFRAASLPAAVSMLRSMSGAGAYSGTLDSWTLGILAALSIAVLTLPNTRQITAWALPDGTPRRPVGLAILLGLIASVAIVHTSRTSEFLYFQF